MYEIFEKLLESEGITIYKFCKESGISESTIYTWRKKKTIARPELAVKVCEYFNVTIDFLMGKTDYVRCPICQFIDDPTSKISNEEHKKYHDKFLNIKEKYPFFMDFSDAQQQREQSIQTYASYLTSMGEKLRAFDDYLKAEFSLEVIRCGYDIDNIDYEQFCKVEVGTMYPNKGINQEFIDELIERYGVDREYMLSNSQLLARVSNNEQMMRIIKYAEKLDEYQLKMVETTVKALVKENENG